MTLSDWFKERPFHLVLSSGFFGFFAHCGFCCALEEQKIRPAHYVGCSAGALVASYLASGNSSWELKELFFSLEKHEFWDPGIGFGLLKGEKFESKIRENLKPTFEQCETPMHVVVLDIFKWCNTIINSGELAPAVRASCAVPGLFQPVKIDRRWYWDGGVTDKIAFTGIDSDTRLFSHYLFSPKLNKNKDLEQFIQKKESQWRGLAIQDIIRVTPNQLENGPKAFEHAFNTTTKLLKTPLNQLDRVHLTN